jgi:hypothetical protein
VFSDPLQNRITHNDVNKSEIESDTEQLYYGNIQPHLCDTKLRDMRTDMKHIHTQSISQMLTFDVIDIAS